MIRRIGRIAWGGAGYWSSHSAARDLGWWAISVGGRLVAEDTSACFETRP